MGKVYSLSGKHPVYAPYNDLPRGGPPFHPRCSKSIIAFNERLATPEQRQKAQPDDTTRAMQGKTPAEAQRIYQQSQRIEEAQGDFITDAEATSRLRPLGVARVSVGKHERVADHVLPALERVISTTGVAPASVTFDASVFRAARQVSPLNVNPATRQLRVKPEYPHWDTMDQRAKDRFEAGAWASDHADHAFFHEMAHLALAAKISSADYVALREAKFAGADRKRISAAVSDAATHSHIEFIAEVYAARRAGRRLPVWVAALYVSLGGP